MDKEFWFLIILAAALVLNLCAFCLYKIDKEKAKKGKWRITERTLLLSAVPGGIGARLGMTVWHHKTQKWYFRVWVGFWALVHAALYIYLGYILLIK